LRAAAFFEEWKEKAIFASAEADARMFFSQFLWIFGVSRKQIAVFEQRVLVGEQVDFFGKMWGFNRGYIDLFWKDHIIIVMVTPGDDVKKAYIRARDYAKKIPLDDHPVGILICDFVTFDFYNLGKDDMPVFFTLKDLPQYVELIGYFAGYRDVGFEAVSPIDFKAVERMEEVYNALKNYS
jgi:hypothetical protein